MENNDDDNEFKFESDDERLEFKKYFDEYKNSQGLFGIDGSELEGVADMIQFFNHVAKEFQNGKHIIEIPTKNIGDKNVRIYITPFGNIISN